MFAENLKTLRLNRGISQQRLGEAMGVSAVAVGKWEKGMTSPDMNKLMLLADYFGVTMDQLVRGTVEPAAADESARENARKSASGSPVLREDAGNGTDARTSSDWEEEPEVWRDNLWFSSSDAEHGYEEGALPPSYADAVIQGGPGDKRMQALIEHSVARGIARYWEMMDQQRTGSADPAHDASARMGGAGGRNRDSAPSAGQKASRYRFPRPTYARTPAARGGFDPAGRSCAMARSERGLSPEDERMLTELARSLWSDDTQEEE